MSVQNGEDVREPLLNGSLKSFPAAEAKLAKTSESLRARVETISKRVQQSRDHPSTLLGCAVLFGVLSGLVAYVYSMYFEAMLWVIWEVRIPCPVSLRRQIYL